MADSGPSPPGDSWSDNRCREIASRDNFPAVVEDLNIQRSIIDRFLNFYLRGRPQKGLSVTDVTFAVLAIMPSHENTEQFLFQRQHYSNDGTLFFLSADDKLKASVDDITADQKKSVDEKNVEADSLDIDAETQTNKSTTNEEDNNDAEKQTDEEHVERSDEKKLQKTEEDTNVAAKENNNGNSTYMINNPQGKSDEINDQQQRNEGTSGEFKKANIPIFPPDLIKYPKPKSAEKEERLLQYGPVENAAFIISCNKLLDEWHTNQKARIILKYFFGIVALILMRTVTKKYTHLLNTFGSSKFLTTISFAKHYVKYCIPHKKCFKKCFRVFSRRDENIPVMFAKIVVNSLYIDGLRRVPDSRLGIVKFNVFKFALLSHTADYGFGLVSMIENLISQLGNINKLVEVTYCEETAESWCRLKEFMATYRRSSSKVSTYHWARIVSTQAFRNISCSTNCALAVILAVFTEKITKSSDIWKSSWVQNAEDLEELKEMGLVMYEKLNGSKEDPTLNMDLFNNLVVENPKFADEMFRYNNEE